MAAQIAHHRFTVAAFEHMIEVGILGEEDRVELIAGEIAEMSPIGDHHAGCVKRLNALFTRHLESSAIVSIQDPIQLDEYSRPQPDVAVLTARADFYSNSAPTPAEVPLIVEVADTSLDYDRKLKAGLYAEADIPELWVVNIPQDRVEVYTHPANGNYQQVRLLKRGEEFTSPALPGLVLRPEMILG